MVNVILMHLWMINFCPRFGTYLHPQSPDPIVCLPSKPEVIIPKCS